MDRTALRTVSTAVPLVSASAQDAALEMLQVRQRAKRYFEAPVRSDPAWKLMLALYASEGMARGSNIGSVAKLADVPRTSALRWLTKLERHGFVSVSRSKVDRRAIVVQLTRKGWEATHLSLGLRAT